MTGPLLALLMLTAQDAAFLSPIEEGVMRCTEVADGAARLACYDRTARPLRELRMAAPAAAPPAGTAGAARATPGYAVPDDTVQAPAPRAETPSDEPRYAETSSPAPAARRAEQRPDGLPVDVPVTEVSFGPRGAARLVLANGQVWDQLSSDSTKLKPSRRDMEAGLTATVKRGALGSRRMTVEPTGKTIRVRPAE